VETGAGVYYARRVRRFEAVAVVALLAVGVWLRAVHLGTPSLWWDELVHVRTAQAPDAGAVVRAVREGIAPAAGNAGAVPLDYLALHAWIALVPAPAPERLERYYRFPSFLFSCATIVALWWTARRIAGPVAALAATTLLATSVFHALYAAEARFYSLFVLGSVANLAAFAAVLDAPARPRAWAAYALVNVGYVLSGLYGAFPIAWEHAVLAASLVARRRRGERVPLLVPALGLAVVGAVVVAYLWQAPIALKYPRPPALAATPAWAPVAETMEQFAAGDRALGWAFLAAFPLALWGARTARDRRLAVAATLALSLASIPAIVAIAAWKQYYYHPRHAIFLLPMAHLATAMALDALAPRRRIVAALLAVLLPVAVAAPTMRTYAAAPAFFFARTKTEHDLAGVARDLAARVATLAPGDRYLLLAEKNRPGHLANPVLAFYLDAYGIADRVILRGFADPPRTLAALATTCADDHCRGAGGMPLALRLGAPADPFDQLPPLRRLLALGGHDVPWAAPVAGVGAIVWAPGLPTPPGLRRRDYRGCVLFEPAG
jgi:hypothetical protein